MTTRRLLYISVNDGSDTRIGKEIRTLARSVEVTFVGVRQDANVRSQLPAGTRQFILQGWRRGPWTIIRLAMLVWRLGPASFDTVHVVNENLLLAMLPVLLTARRIVLDIFDSAFLTGGLLGGVLRHPAQWLVHNVCEVALVTDDNRLGLIPAAYRCNVRVVPNYPSSLPELPPRRVVSPTSPLRIFLSGTITNGRGLEFLEALMQMDPSVEVVAAGWVNDAPGRLICQHPRVTFLGVITPAEAARVARDCDYILCLYAPTVPNNIHASPNKIYDSALLGVPVIINAEVLAARLVREEGLGFVLPGYYPPYDPGTPSALKSGREVLRGQGGSRFTWESVEDTLLAAHLAG